MGRESNAEMGEGKTMKTQAFLPSDSNFPVLPSLLTFNNNFKTLDSFSPPILLLKRSLVVVSDASCAPVQCNMYI